MELDDLNGISRIDLIALAFEKGYNLGFSDKEDGIYIDFSEIRNCFLEELSEHYSEGTRK